MKTTIVCGMLGSGKTSFIRNVLRTADEKAVVLVNDFGQAGIDGEIFSAGGVEAIELPSGCVCCTLKFDLLTSLRRVTDVLKPDHLYIEPSGVASPSAVIESLDCLDINPYSVIGLVDATEFLEQYSSDMYGRFFLDQITMSDVILVNKADLAAQSVTDETVRTIEGLNPRAVVYQTSHAVLHESLPVPLERETRVTGKGHTLHFETISLKIGVDVGLDKVQELFRDLAEGKFGAVVRAKALVMTDKGPYRIDLASGVMRSEAFPREIGEGRIVVIGSSIRKDGLTEQVREYETGEEP